MTTLDGRSICRESERIRNRVPRSIVKVAARTFIVHAAHCLKKKSVVTLTLNAKGNGHQRKTNTRPIRFRICSVFCGGTKKGLKACRPKSLFVAQFCEFDLAKSKLPR